MNVYGKHYRTIWLNEADSQIVQIIDQRHLPHKFVVEDLKSVDMYIAALHAPQDGFMESLMAAGEQLKATRPTAVNLAWAVGRQLEAIGAVAGNHEAKVEVALETAQTIADEDAEFCRRLGEHGVGLIEEISKKKKGEPVNILTHCNAGWLAFVDYGWGAAHRLGAGTAWRTSYGDRR